MPAVSPDTQAATPSLAIQISHLAGLLASEHFPSGDRAMLKRLDPARPPGLAFYRFALRHLPDGWQAQVGDWQVILQGMALMAPQIHDPDLPFGRALAENRYSEARLERLLAIEGDTRRTLLLRAIRFLASRKLACNWYDIARLLLTRESDKLERLHRQIATDYYRHQPQQDEE